jgi:ribonuclease M5
VPLDGTFLHMKKTLFVVEGIHDETHLKSLYPGILTLSVGGSAINNEALTFLKHHQHVFEIVLLLDPDYPGNKIRHKLEQELESVYHVFVDEKKARHKRKIGIEHMSKKDLDEALKKVIKNSSQQSLTKIEFIELQLQGSPEATQRKNTLCHVLHLGKPNAKTLFKRLNMIGMTKSNIEDILNETSI